MRELAGLGLQTGRARLGGFAIAIIGQPLPRLSAELRLAVGRAPGLVRTARQPNEESAAEPLSFRRNSDARLIVSGAAVAL
jgi:hypothetical protein